MSARSRSGRLKMIQDKVLCLCACGNTKLVLIQDIIWGRATACSGNCRARLDIRHPHYSSQRILSKKTGQLIQEGPPIWDPVLRKGVFQKEKVKVKICQSEQAKVSPRLGLRRAMVRARALGRY